ncbi:precorrin-3B synthase [Methylorubrum extorquens]|uniref:precorrin-3B synthase n=1 Tax=Methylorubrum extorquens TaxID=408 RepID=UPI00097292EC|nr:precorrin-3B synthase [Methylorubrum extorquens]APX87911.1 precorrin-3B synthase [Methylorubrum extorquens]MCG5248075.1 precorrin-3B synthase [Methylorubrum extorquens]
MSARRSLPEGARRGWCPSLARPMPTGDGLLARIHPPLGRLTPAQLRAVADGSRAYGNGHIDVTARGNLQIRGVSEASAAPLACALAQAGLGDTRDDGGPQRLTLTAPLAGLDPTEQLDVPALARAVEAAGLAVPGLPPKTLVAIDGGGAHGLGAVEADFFLFAEGPGQVAFGLATETGPLRCGVLLERQAAGAIGLALAAFAEIGGRRMRDLDAHGRAVIAAVAGFFPFEPTPLAPAPAPAAPGLAALSADRAALLVQAPFGRCTADRLEQVAVLAGAQDVRLSAERGLALVVPASRSAVLQADLARAGFIVTPDDPRRAVAACPGAPACRSGTTPVPDHAARLAQALAPLAGLTAHVSGCAKGCAHPGPADLTLVGRDGAYDVVLAGPPSGEPATRLAFEVALDRIRKAAAAGLPALDPVFQDDVPG